MQGTSRCPRWKIRQFKTLIERLVNIKAEALVDDLIDKLAEKEAKTLNDTNVKVKA